MIETDDHGFVLPRAQLHRLGDAIHDVLALSESERLAIGKAARRRVMKQFHAGIERDSLRAALQQAMPAFS